MSSEHSKSVADRAKLLYAGRLQKQLEAEHRGRYVAIEPASGEHYLADSYGDAVAKSRHAHPDQIAFVIRVGHDAAVHIGVLSN